MNDHQDADLKLQRACSDWTWDEKLLFAIAFCMAVEAVAEVLREVL